MQCRGRRYNRKWSLEREEESRVIDVSSKPFSNARSQNQRQVLDLAFSFPLRFLVRAAVGV